MQAANKLEICKQTRKFTARSLHTVLKKLLATNRPISEVMFRDAWLTELRKNKNIFSDGWYDPPPHGIIVLFATDKHVTRLNFLSVRPEEKWPRDDIFLNKENGIAYVYASPVNKNSGVIGDFGMTLYFGKNKEIKDLLEICLDVDKQIFEAAQTGMQLGEIAEISRQMLKPYGMQNEFLAVTDKGTNVLGHTIPDEFTSWSSKEKEILAKNNWELTKDIISKKRINVKDNELFVITRNSAITIEPRPKTIEKPDLPKSLGYHTIALFKEDGSKELLTDFDELFTLAGMNYMIEQ